MRENRIGVVARRCSEAMVFDKSRVNSRTDPSVDSTKVGRYGANLLERH